MLLTNAFDPDPRVHHEAVSLVQNGYEVTILCWDRDYKKAAVEVVDGIGVERIYVRSTHGRGTTQMFFLFVFWLKALLRGFSTRCDAIHCHDFDTLPLGAMQAVGRSLAPAGDYISANYRWPVKMKLFDELIAGTARR
ncbi:MAG TPA: glycosyltransferase [Syntrophobacteraceae bacterium]|nr:glycosyltransferase [Syntrophobacteraceae bacterium]